MAKSMKMSNTIDHQAKQIVYNVYTYFRKRKLDKTTYEHTEDINLTDTVSEMTGITKTHVKKIIKDGNTMQFEDGFAMFRPKEKKMKVERKPKILVDEFTEAIIRRKVIQLPNMRKLNVLLKEENILQCGKDYLKKLLHKLGFTNENDCPGFPGVLRERADLASERMKFLQDLKVFRNKGKSIFYLNETKDWLNPCEDPKGGMPYFVMVHISGEAGFLDNTQLKLKVKPNPEEDTCYEYCENYDWIKDTIMPNIPPNSVIVFNIPFSVTQETDSKVYDEKPSLDEPKSSFEAWLNKYNIPFKENALKSELIDMIDILEAQVRYSITKVIRENGHELLHLPENHVDLNPVAIMWHDVKEDAGRVPADVLFMNYPKNKWDDCLEHVKENEEIYYAYGLKISDPNYYSILKRQRLKRGTNVTKALAVTNDSDSEEDEDSPDCE